MKTVKLRLVTRHGNILCMECPPPAPKEIKLPKPFKGTLHSATKLLKEPPRILFFVLDSYDLAVDAMVYREADEGTDTKTFPIHELSKVWKGKS